MELVVDAAVLFSFFKPDSFTRTLFKQLYISRVRFFTPEFLLEELLSLEDRICRYSSITSEDFRAAYILLSEVIEVIQKSEYEEFIPEALKLLPKHPKDVPYFALALKLHTPIWSNEKRFKQQSTVKVFKTHELKKLFGH